MVKYYNSLGEETQIFKKLPQELLPTGREMMPTVLMTSEVDSLWGPTIIQTLEIRIIITVLEGKILIPKLEMKNVTHREFK